MDDRPLRLIAANPVDRLARTVEALLVVASQPLSVADLADADLAEAVPGTALGIFGNQGEVCSAGSRIFVERSVYDDVLSASVTAVEGMSVGDPATDDEIGMGPVISAEQQERVLGFVERAKAAKATLSRGKQGPP